VINKDLILGKWKEISGEAQKKWGEITENDLEKVKGNMTALVGLVEQKLGVSKEDAQKKVEELLGKIAQHDLKGKAEATAGKVLETANVILDVLKDKMKK
jgi:uncharacterized protein YjbJ (UPF0337 family)